MKKILIITICLISIKCFAIEKKTTFSTERFNQAQSNGKIVIINSWNKTCTTCKKQIKILDQAKNDFEDILFLSFEQTKDKEIAKFLSIEYWTTIVAYKNGEEVYRSIGQTNQSKIYSIINSL